MAVETRLSDDPVHIEADPAQIQQTLINLLVNANDAMANGGRLKLEVLETMARNSMRGPQKLRRLGRRGHRLRHEPGRPGTDLRARLHDKGERHGTGLGLTTVKRVVVAEELGGSIRVITEPGRGTRLEVSFPGSRAGASRTRPRSPPTGRPPTGRPATGRWKGTRPSCSWTMTGRSWTSAGLP